MNTRLVDYSSSEESNSFDSDETRYTSSDSEDEITAEHFRNRFCPFCSINFSSVATLQQHLSHFHIEYYQQFKTFNQTGEGLSRNDFNIEYVRGAIDNTYEEYKIDLSNQIPITINQLFRRIKRSLLLLLKRQLQAKKNFKIQFIANLHFEKTSADGQKTLSFPAFNSFLFGINHAIDFSFVFTKALLEFKNRIESYTNMASSFVFISVLEFKIVIAEYKNFTGGNHVEQYPEIFKRKMRNLYDVPSVNQLCFKRAVHLHPKFRPPFPRSSNTKAKLLKDLNYYDQLFINSTINWSGIKFPFSISQIKRFESNNPTIGLCIIAFDSNYSLNIPKSRNITTSVDDVIASVVNTSTNSGDNIMVNTQLDLVEETQQNTSRRHRKVELLEDFRKKCYTLYTCKEDREIRIDLLMYLGEKQNHFLYIHNLHGLLFRSAGYNATEVCRFCLQSFSKFNYESHKSSCAAIGCQKTNFPKQMFLKFDKFERCIRYPFVFFCDMESNLIQLDQTECHLEQETSTRKLSIHCPGSFSYVCIDNKDNVYAKQAYYAKEQNENIAHKMVMELFDIAKNLSKKIKYMDQVACTTMVLTEADQEMLATYVSCCICSKKFEQSDTNLHRHHDHSITDGSPNFIGLAHQQCNMKAAQKSSEFVCVFHGFKNYDSKLIMEALQKDSIDSVTVIPNSTEKFNAIFMKRKGITLKFIDSYAFFNCSLNELAKTLSEQDFRITCQVFPGNEDKIDLLYRKGVYCYSFMDNVDKYKLTSLPPIGEFKNDLTGLDITQEDYELAITVWNEFDITNMGDYTNIYCLSDTSFLADSFIKLRNVMYKAFGLDVCHYFSLPMFIYDACLKYTQVELENIKCPVVYLIIEEGLRGGLVSVGNIRTAKANNPLVPDYNPNDATTFLVMMDVTNLYGTAMVSKLPERDYMLVRRDELERICQDPEQFFENIEDDGRVGYFVKLDVQIPSELHDKLNKYPPMPYKRLIDVEEISSHMMEFGKEMEVDMNTFKTKRLIADFHDRKNYVCHYRLLKYWMKLGCKVIKVHAAVKFIQTDWLRKFMEFNATMRKAATSKMEDLIWKLCNCATFGKMIEAKRNRVNVKLIMGREMALKYNSKPTIQSVNIVHKDLVIIQLKKLSVTLDRPIAVGAACLEVSKLIMFQWFYDYFLQKYPKLDLVYSDTDSLLMLIQTNNFYQDCKDNEGELFDISCYDTNHPYFGQFHSLKNKKKLGTMKDEYAMCVLTHACVNKPKLYALRYVKDGIDSATGLNVNTIKKGKGIPHRA